MNILRSKIRPPSDNARYSLISSNFEPLRKEQLEERLNCLINERKFRNMSHNIKKSYNIKQKCPALTKTTNNSDTD